MLIILIIVFLLILGSITLLTYVLAPFAIKHGEVVHEERVQKSVANLESIFIFAEKRKVYIFIFVCPIIVALLGWLLLKNMIGLLIGFAFGLMLPSMTINAMKEHRKNKFAQQLIDALMVISSALKGGLSFTQSIEVLCEEMPPPIKDEFGQVLRETKVGIQLDDALKHLADRMPSEELDLFISSVLVARETGGDLTKVFSKLISTIRERSALKEKISTYTIQGKMQGIVMSILPFAFVIWVYKANPHHFDVMLKTDVGRGLIVGAVVLQIVALFLIKKFSTIKL